ncbi:hypothetical protein IW262DRAFT_1451463 [Armillaria fumosa]|nr:hypothetical protein IW262DRAFT_1451463 [Armillaria fumosa]
MEIDVAAVSEPNPRLMNLPEILSANTILGFYGRTMDIVFSYVIRPPPHISRHSPKNHPSQCLQRPHVLAQLIHNLATFDHSWFLNCPTAMFSTGTMFLSIYDPIRIFPKSIYGKNAEDGEAPHSFFSYFYGSSWHADDAAFIGFLGHWGNKVTFAALVVLIAGLVFMMLLIRQHKQVLRLMGWKLQTPINLTSATFIGVLRDFN